MDRLDPFWQSIATDIMDKFHTDHPSGWPEEEVTDFVLLMDGKLKKIILGDRGKAAKCGVRFHKGRLMTREWVFNIHTTTWRSYFKPNYSRKSAGRSTNRNCFAIFFGYKSAIDYKKQKRIPTSEIKSFDRQLKYIGKSYNRLIGRKSEVLELMAALQSNDGKWIIGIDGMGGIGKTALAQEVAQLCLTENLFEKVIWVSAAKPFIFQEAQSAHTKITIENVLNTIMLEIAPIKMADPHLKDKLEHVKTLLHNYNILLVLDNLDTAIENQNKIIETFLTLLRDSPSKAVFTSRKRFKFGVYHVSLVGLDQRNKHQNYDSCIEFIHQEGRDKNRMHILDSDIGALNKIAQQTGGSPKAMQLVIGQLGHRELGFVLGKLKNVSIPQKKMYGNEYIQFYQSIFFSSFELLSKDVVPLLLLMAHFVPNLGSSPQNIQNIFHSYSKQNSGNKIDFEQSIDELWEMAFLEKKLQSIEKVKYYLHPLTQNFIKSDIVNLAN